MRRTFHDEDDSDPQPRRRPAEVGDLDITPMIDCVFLLLIFFMVTSTMKQPAAADVPPARYGVGADPSEAVVVTVSRPAVDAEPVVRLPDGSAPTLAELRRTDALFKLVDAARTGDPPRNEVILNADRDLPHGVVREVSQMIGRSEGVRLYLGVQDQ